VKVVSARLPGEPEPREPAGGTESNATLSRVKLWIVVAERACLADE